MAGAERLVLGTVQLGRPYGRRAAEPLTSGGDALAILDAAWELGIRGFDSAEAYGESGDRLAAWLDVRGTRSAASVVTKVRVDDPRVLPQRLRAALGPFAGVASLILLTHGPAAGHLWDTVRWSAEAVGARAGQSVYTPEEVHAAAGASGVALIQAPGNVFDQRALQARGGAAVPLDLRSVYLQGVLLERPADAERRAPGAGVLAEAVQRAAAEAGESPAPLLVAAVLAWLRERDRVVVGVDRAGEVPALARALELSPQAVETFRRRALAHLHSAPSARTLDPRGWPARP